MENSYPSVGWITSIDYNRLEDLKCSKLGSYEQVEADETISLPYIHPKSSRLDCRGLESSTTNLWFQQNYQRNLDAVDIRWSPPQKTLYTRTALAVLVQVPLMVSEQHNSTVRWWCSACMLHIKAQSRLIVVVTWWWSNLVWIVNVVHKESLRFVCSFTLQEREAAVCMTITYI